VIPVPPAYLDAANRTHEPQWRVSILDRAGVVQVANLPVVAGGITRDNSGSPRTSVNCDVATQQTPQPIDQRYLPTGGRLRVEYRIAELADWVVLADVDMVASAIARPESMWTLAGVGPDARIDLDDLARGARPALTGTVGAAVTALIRRTFPNAPVTVTGAAATQPVPTDYELPGDGSPWRAVEFLATSAGAEVYASGHTREFIVRDIPGITTPVDRLGTGAGGVVTGYTLNHEMGYNSVALRYEVKDAEDTEIRTGRWTDTRSTSPVAVQRIGSEVVYAETVRASAAPTQVEADAAAARMGSRVGGRARRGQVRHPTRPWLEPGDTVTVRWLGGPEESHVVEAVQIPLSQENVQVTTLATHQYAMGVPV